MRILVSLLVLVLGFLLSQSPADASALNNSSGFGNGRLGNLLGGLPANNSSYADFKPLLISRDLGYQDFDFTVGDFKFSGNEGDYGTLLFKLKNKPPVPVSVTVTGSHYFTADMDGKFINGFSQYASVDQSNWMTPQKIKFVSEIDTSPDNRDASTEKLHFEIKNAYDTSNGSLKPISLRYEFAGMPTIQNTNSPDPTHFNIDYDWRLLSEDPYWTPDRRAAIMNGASIAADHIGNEWGDFVINADNIKAPSLANSLKTKNVALHRGIDDILVVVFPFNTISFPGFAGLTQVINLPGSPSPSEDRFAFMAFTDVIVPGFNANLTLNQYRSLALHETGHALGLVGINSAGAAYVTSGSPKTFIGPNAEAANGGNAVILDSQGTHPETNVSLGHYHSSMSYLSTGNPATGGDYDVCQTQTSCDYTALDLAMLKDHGYNVH